MLNDNQIKEFKNNGFVCIPGLFDKAEIINEINWD